MKKNHTRIIFMKILRYNSIEHKAGMPTTVPVRDKR